jgi:hypothetical protein
LYIRNIFVKSKIHTYVEGVRVVVFNIISDVDDVQGVRVVVFNIISDVDDVEGVRVVVFNIIFNNIAVISWRSVLLVEETLCIINPGAVVVVIVW